jgi:hypothetical protein
MTADAGLVQRIIELLTEHQFSPCTNDREGECVGATCTWHGDWWPQWRGHVAELIAKVFHEREIITTIEQLDALPDGAAILVYGNAVQKLYGRWYPAGGTEIREVHRMLVFPALLLWSPDWDTR